MTTTPVRDRTAWLLGGDAVCHEPPPLVHRTWRLILLGAPGAGKSTQAALLSRTLGACPLSTGDVFRDARGRPLRHGSAMAHAHAALRRGEFVPDATVVGLVRERCRCLHCRGGFLLDGFPRTLPQAAAIDDLLAIEAVTLDAVISYELSFPAAMDRIAGRRICPECKAAFHLTVRPPRRAGICNHCGAVLVQRAEDREEIVRTRLEAYAEATAPLVEHYRAAGLLVPIDASGRPDEIFAHSLDGLADRFLPR